VPTVQDVMKMEKLSQERGRLMTAIKALLHPKSLTGILMCLPLFILIIGLIIYPFFYSIHLSMLNKRETAFVGLENLGFLLGYETFRLVVRNSVTFTFTAVFFKAAFGFILALAINALPIRGQRIWRGISLIAWVMPLSLSTLGWWWIFEPTHSALNWLLVQLGISPKPWLSDPFWARFATILVNIWFGTPFFMIMFLAALKSIPQMFYEAAAIDGATAVQRLRYITLPMLKNIIAITMLFSTITTFANFDIVRVLTRGGPRDTTHLFGTYSFQLGIQGGDIPLGAAVSLFMFPILAVSAFFILRGVRRSV